MAANEVARRQGDYVFEPFFIDIRRAAKLFYRSKQLHREEHDVD